MNGPAPAGGDTAANLGLGLLGAAALSALALRAAADAACWATGKDAPTGGLAAAAGVLARPGDPGAAFGVTGLSPVAYWAAFAAIAAAAAATTAWAWLAFRRHGRRAGNDPHRTPGTATRDDVKRHASARALTRRGAALRPSVAKPAPAQVGYLLGRAHGTPVWASVEDSMLVLGPPRSGKGLHIVVNAILDAPGPVVATSTRPDNLTATLQARREAGPVAVFDPQRLAEGLPAGLRWSPVRGCEQPQTAMVRAAGLAAGTGIGGKGVEDGGFWEGKTRTALQSLLHAAALDGRSARDLFAWTLDPQAAVDAVTVLRTSAGAAEGWADSLDAAINSDPRTRDSIWQGVSLSLGSLADPRVLDAVTPRDGEGFDPEAFLRDSGTLYLLATGAGAGASAALVSALVEDLTETARRIAARSPGARLDPPLLLALDEIGNLAPLPSLPTLMADGGGNGITTMPVLQSLAQARAKWGEHAAAAIWDAAIVKVILGGASATSDLRDISTLIGEREETARSDTTGETGRRSVQTSTRRVPVLPPEAVRTMPFGTAVTMLRSAPPIITRLRPWTGRPDADRLRADRAALERRLQTAGRPPAP